MSEPTAIARVQKSVRVKAPLERAFEIFTSGLTRWWPANHGIGDKPIAKVWMEPKLDGPLARIVGKTRHRALEGSNSRGIR